MITKKNKIIFFCSQPAFVSVAGRALGWHIPCVLPPVNNWSMVDTTLALAISGTVLAGVAVLAIVAIGIYAFVQSDKKKSSKSEKMYLVDTKEPRTLDSISVSNTQGYF